ncbi:MAG: nitrous oxide reductase accessory protein NosL [Marinobacter sp.]|uniref:nitrous oxide reductase accessory protein NosL n=1 Tax=Marinobacter sp. TaxID=50741 RepID=UPI00299D5F2D|nr:nitrous oxide reductase accessory protein NosL [Marinobacter sp.]MDX1755372.1 nitrous oxide reductase accessory protein NosL [Marinobacter sp.]
MFTSGRSVVLDHGYWVGLALLLMWLAGCSPSGDGVTGAHKPVHFESGDECHVCGMVIQRFSGPKGQAIGSNAEEGEIVRKFCSTRDLFAWVLQPENIHRNLTLYVHNMAQTDWKNPADTALIDAREAFFVVGSSREGAMGPSLASFASQQAAEDFAERFGGSVLEFSHVTLAHLQSGTGGQGTPGNQPDRRSMGAMTPYGEDNQHPE